MAENPAASDDALIDRLGRARLAGRPLDGAAALMPSADAATGYAVQTGLAAWLSANGQGAHSGYKIGATTKGMQALLGVPGPVYGHILSENILQPGSAFACDPASRPGVECEIAFRLGADLPQSPAPVTRDAVAACIDAVIPAIEIVENRYGDYRHCSVGLLAADDFFHKACVLGEAVPDWRATDLPSVTGRTRVDGDRVEEGRGAAVLGHPLDAVVWLAGALADQGATLKTGQIVLTGSMTPVHWIEHFPAEIAIDIEPIGGSTVTLTERA